MKSLLLLLALELVASDKLDRTYLPPPGAKLAGGRPDDLKTPLEYPKDTYPGIVQNGIFPGALAENAFTVSPSNQGLDIGMSKSVIPIDFLTSAYPNDFSQAPLFPNTGYEPTMTTLSIDNNIGLYGFPSKLPNFLNRNAFDTQPYITSTLKPESEKTSIASGFTETDSKGKEPGYYYGPELQIYGNDLLNLGLTMIDSSNVLNSENIQNPNQENNGYVSNGPTFTPKTATADDIVPNYQPSAFGYYGGNPMIMTAQNSTPQKLGDTVSKFGEYESNLPAMISNQDERNINRKTTARPFQTPLVGERYKQNENKSGVTDTSTVPPNYKTPSQTSKTTSRLLSKEKVPIMIEQRNSIAALPRFRPERPQSQADRRAVILNQENAITPDGYSYSYDTSYGIHADETGTATDGVRTKGSYSYTGDDGKLYSITYTADENGFQPRGDHLPTPPPIPEAIKKVIQQAARDKAVGSVDDGSYDEKKYGHMNYQGAMERYLPFNKNNGFNSYRKTDSKVSRPSVAQKRPTTNIANGNNDDTNAISDNNNDIPNTGNQSVNRFYQVHDQNASSKEFPTKGNTGNVNNIPKRGNQYFLRPHSDDSTKYTQKSFFSKNNRYKNYPNKTPINIKTESRLREPNDQYTEQVRNQNKPASTLVNRFNNIRNKGNPITDTFSQTHNPDMRYKTENINTNNNIQGTPSQFSEFKPNTIDAVTYTDDGYYYIPPIIKFNPTFEQSSYKNNPYIPSGRPIHIENVATIASKRTGIDNNQEQQTIVDRTTSTQMPFNENTDFTRTPYITSLNGQHEKQYYAQIEVQTKSPNDNDRFKIPMFTKDLNSPFYESSTTPMPSQTTQYRNQPTDGYLNQQYQSTITPAVFGQTPPSLIENRLNIPSEIPGISISQDLTTTFRPATLRDGINLEVNQNVQIYGLGRSKPTDATSGYPEKVSTYSNKFFTTTFPNEQSFTGTHFDNLLEGPVQDNGIVQGPENQDTTYGNEFYTSVGPRTEIDSGSIGPYAGPDFGRQLEFNKIGTSKTPISTSNTFEDAQFKPVQEQTSSVFADQPGAIERVIGEDFSGPKQPERFDPETGYYYR